MSPISLISKRVYDMCVISVWSALTYDCENEYLRVLTQIAAIALRVLNYLSCLLGLCVTATAAAPTAGHVDTKGSILLYS